MLLSAVVSSDAIAETEKCTTPAEALDVIVSGNGFSSLVTDVAQSVPADPENCVPSYCEAAKDKPEKVRTAVGAGFSEALAQQEAKEDYEMAKRILVSACRPECDEIVLAAFAASQATTVRRLCDASAAGSRARGLGAGQGAGNGGGGQPASVN